LGSSLSLRSMARLASSLSVMGYAHVGSSMSMRALLRMGSSISVLGSARFGSTVSVLGCAQLGSSLSLRSVARLASAMSVLDFVHLGSTLSVRYETKFGSDVFTHGKLFFSDTTYLEDVSGSLKATVGGNSAMSLTSSGGTLHGTWYSDTVISVSDRRLKDNITPLQRTLRQNKEAYGLPGAEPTEGSESSTAFGWVLRQLRPVSYNFKKGSDAKNMRFGFIADEVERVLPQVVRELPGKEGDPDRKKGIVYPDLIAVLTGMMREFSTQLKAVQSRVKTAELELDRLDREEPMDES